MLSRKAAAGLILVGNGQVRSAVLDKGVGESDCGILAGCGGNLGEGLVRVGCCRTLGGRGGGGDGDGEVKAGGWLVGGWKGVAKEDERTDKHRDE